PHGHSDGAAATQQQATQRQQAEGREGATAQRAAGHALELALIHAVERPGGGSAALLGPTEGELDLLLTGDPRGPAHGAQGATPKVHHLIDGLDVDETDRGDTELPLPVPGGGGEVGEVRVAGDRAEVRDRTGDLPLVRVADLLRGDVAGALLHLVAGDRHVDVQ